MAPVVETSLGKIRGSNGKTRNNRPFFAFKKLPYARPPVGKLRFARPVPVVPWTGILDASKKECPPCLQLNMLNPESKNFTGVEDCLYLNVFTPRLPGNGQSHLLPVIVYFHGSDN